MASYIKYLYKTVRKFFGEAVVVTQEVEDIISSAIVRLLEHCSQIAAATDVLTQTQVRIAANIANGIKHAFNEFQCSEIIIGMHMHPERSPKFWGEFHQSLFNGLSRQIIMARIRQPLNTIRRIHKIQQHQLNAG